MYLLISGDCKHSLKVCKLDEPTELSKEQEVKERDDYSVKAWQYKNISCSGNVLFANPKTAYL